MVSIVRAVQGVPGIPPGFPIILDANMAIIEPVFSWLSEYANVRGRGCTPDTVRTYAEHIYDWFDCLEQSGIDWRTVDEYVIAEYRNRMIESPSPHTSRSYSRTTINARVSSVCRFYDWAFERGLITEVPFRRQERLVRSVGVATGAPYLRPVNNLTLALSEKLPRPLRVEEVKRLFACLDPTPRLAAEWALTAGLRRKEICGLTIDMIPDSRELHVEGNPLVGIPLKVTKGGRPRTVYPPIRLIDQSNWYVGYDRAQTVRGALARDKHYRPPSTLFLTAKGTALSRERLTAIFAKGFATAGLNGSLHWLRHTFALLMLARLQQQARNNTDLNPLKVLQVLLGHRSIETTGVYLRCVEVYDQDLAETLSWLYGEVIKDAD